MLGAARKVALRKQVFLVPKMLDAALDQPVGVRKDARPSRAVSVRQQQAVAFLDQLAVQRIDLGAARLERLDPLQADRDALAMRIARMAPASAGVGWTCTSGCRYRHVTDPRCRTGFRNASWPCPSAGRLARPPG